MKNKILIEPFIKNASIENLFYKAIGIVFLILAKIKHSLKGYSTPRTFSNKEYERAARYDTNVVNGWLSILSKYSNDKITIKEKNVLELGPGADLGVGLYLLSKEIKHYNACDAHDLIQSAPADFYKYFFKFLYQINPNIDIQYLKTQLNLTQRRQNDKLNYVCNRHFDLLSVFKKESIDIVFSQAAFEHFDNIELTLIQLSKITKPNGILIAEVDLKTHSRWIRDRDPNNIYRYSNRLYTLFKFRGIPNRVRPYFYKKILSENGWYNIEIIPKTTLNQTHIKRTNNSFDPQFRDPKNQMDYLSILICATKK